MCCFDGGCRQCAGFFDHGLSTIDVAAENGEWHLVAERIGTYDAVSCPPEARPLLDALLFQRGLVTIEEPGRPWLLVVTLEDAAEAA